MRKTAFLVNDISMLGGSKRVTVNLANNMSSQDEIKIISLFNSSKEATFSINNNIEIITLYKRNIQIYELSTYIRFIKELKMKPILNLFFTLIYLLVGYPFKRNQLQKILQTMDNVVVPEVYGLLFISKKLFLSKKIYLQLHSTFDYIIKNHIIKWVLKTYQNKIQGLIVLTDCDKEAFEKIGFNNVIRIYNPISCSYEVKHRNITNKVVYLGRLDIVKGIDYLLDIFYLLLCNQEVSLEIYGEGAMRKEIEKFIIENKLCGRVNIHGYVENVYEAIKDANCLIAPSRHEGLPMVFLEAFQCQVPVVSFRSFPGIEEIITEGENGFIVEIGDVEGAAEKVKLLLTDKNLNKIMGDNALKGVGKFDINQIISEWHNVFDSK